jgi:hypothetical protein
LRFRRGEDRFDPSLTGERTKVLRAAVVRSFSISLVAALTCGCVGGGSVAVLYGGAARLNPSLMYNFGPAPGDGGRGSNFEACDANETGACRVDPVVVRSVAPAELRNLRRAAFLWVGSGPAGLRLTYEWVAADTSIRDDSGTVLVPNASVGTCRNFGEFDSLTRQRFRRTGGAEIRVPQVRGLDQLMDVIVRACRAPAPRVSETLEPIRSDSDCSEINVAALRPDRRELHDGETWPVCVKELALHVTEHDDVRLEMRVEPRRDIEAVWRGARLEPQPASPQLMIVPVGGIRTISRRMHPIGNRVVDDGSEWTDFMFIVPELDVGLAGLLGTAVPAAGGDWLENFSPNVIVSRVRVRRGAWKEGVAPDYLSVRRLKFGGLLGTECNSRTDRTDIDEFDVTMCTSDQQKIVQLTPAYRADGAGGRPARIDWFVEVADPVTGSPVDPTTPVFIEFDLTAFPGAVSTVRSGLNAAPPTQDFGLLRAGVPSPPRWAARIHNADLTGVRLDRIEISGRSAAEFGEVHVQRATGGAPQPLRPTAEALPAPLSPDGAIDVFVTPAVVGNEIKDAQLDVHFTGVSNRPDRISVMLRAAAGTPELSVLPTRLVMVLQGTPGRTSLQRGFLVLNSGYVSSERRGVRLEGPDRAAFQLDPPSPSRVLESGDAETLYVTYRPPAAGRHEAAVVVDTADGPLRVDVQGVCVDYCAQPVAIDPRLTPPAPPEGSVPGGR